MKFNHPVSLFYLALSTLTAVVVATTGKEDLDACKRACSDDVHPRLIRFIEPNRVDSEWNDIKPIWSTCQYRCYRCYLPEANAGMQDLDYLFSHNQQNDAGSVQRIALDVDKAAYSFNNCYDQWNKANKLNDTTSTFK